MTIVANPRAYKIPDWFLNRQKDIKDGRYSQVRTAAWGGACAAAPVAGQWGRATGGTGSESSGSTMLQRWQPTAEQQCRELRWLVG